MRGPDDVRLYFEDPWPSDRCRYPLFGEKAMPGQPVFCGAKVLKAGGSFCPACMARVTNTPPTTTKETSE